VGHDLTAAAPELFATSEAYLAAAGERVELTSIGIDIGSATSHAILSRLQLQRLSDGLSSRYVVSERVVLYRSPVLLTPYLADGRIDAPALQAFFEQAYRAAGVTAGQIDTGAVILTGVALERVNARAVAEIFAQHGGRFVCAVAGHNLEAILASHGSGAVARSRRVPGPRVHLDVGGGTAKISVIEAGAIRQTAAVGVGGRLLCFDAGGRITRLEAGGARALAQLGITAAMGDIVSAAEREALAELLAAVAIEVATGAELSPFGRSLLLTSPLRAFRVPTEISLSGGVSEFLTPGRAGPADDLGWALARALVARAAGRGIAVRGPDGDGIRATVIGASQFSLQVSGNTIGISCAQMLPVRGLPVVRPVPDDGTPVVTAAQIRAAMTRLDLDDDAITPLAIWLPDPGTPSYRNLAALVRALEGSVPRLLRAQVPVVIAMQADAGLALATVLAELCPDRRNVAVLDALELRELDFIDVGELIEPAGIVPVVVKSLEFPEHKEPSDG
jgi:ethanolamine utilization protein EutA